MKSKELRIYREKYAKKLIVQCLKIKGYSDIVILYINVHVIVYIIITDINHSRYKVYVCLDL